MQLCAVQHRALRGMGGGGGVLSYRRVVTAARWPGRPVNGVEGVYFVGSRNCRSSVVGTPSGRLRKSDPAALPMMDAPPCASPTRSPKGSARRSQRDGRQSQSAIPHRRQLAGPPPPSEPVRAAGSHCGYVFMERARKCTGAPGRVKRYNMRPKTACI